VTPGRANEPADKPDPVEDDHPSRHAVAGMLVRPTRKLGRAALERLRSTPANRGTSLALLRVGFT